jgi:thioesterase domain-containing protein
VNFANCFTGTNIRLDYEQLAPLPPSAQFEAALAEARRQGTVPAEAPEAFIRRLVHVGEANVQVIQSYRPQSLKQAVHLFVPTTKGGLAEIAGKDLTEEGDHGWNEQVGQDVELHEVPGDHFSMLLGDGVARIAKELSSLIALQNLVT